MKMSLSGAEGYNNKKDAAENAEKEKVEEEEDRDANLEAQEEDSAGGGSGFKDLLLHGGGSSSGRRLSFGRLHTRSTPPPPHGNHSAPPEWALLLVGCLLGLATGLFVAAFNNGVCLVLVSSKCFSLSPTMSISQSQFIYKHLTVNAISTFQYFFTSSQLILSFKLPLYVVNLLPFYYS